MKPEDGNLHRPPKRQLNDNKNNNEIWKKKGERLGRYTPDRFNDGTWKNVKAKWKEMNAKWKDTNATWKEH